MQPLLAHHARGWVVWSPFLSTPDRLKMLKPIVWVAGKWHEISLF
jgi:hypothetical protein